VWRESTIDVPVEILHFDEGGEQVEQLMKRFIQQLKKRQTEGVLTVKKTPVYPKLLQFANRRVVERIRALLHTPGPPNSLWSEAAHYVVCMTS
jgi:hypothetical protein